LNYYINNSNLDIDFKFLSQYILDCNLSGCKHHNGIPLIETYEKLFNEKKTDLPFIFGAGAQFIVSKKSILNRPKEFYSKIVELLQNDINPIEGFVIERFHKIIFHQFDHEKQVQMRKYYIRIRPPVKKYVNNLSSIIFASYK
jgi:hypothetical protein